MSSAVHPDTSFQERPGRLARSDLYWKSPLQRRFARRCPLAARFAFCDGYDVSAFLQRTFDIGYTGAGALCWLPEMGRWAEVVRELMCPGGERYLFEFHPLEWVLSVDEHGRANVAFDYFMPPEGTGRLAPWPTRMPISRALLPRPCGGITGWAKSSPRVRRPGRILMSSDSWTPLYCNGGLGCSAIPPGGKGGTTGALGSL